MFKLKEKGLCLESHQTTQAKALKTRINPFKKGTNTMLNINTVLPQTATLTFKLEKPEGQKTYAIKGRPAQTLLCLVNAGKQGVTAEELSSWALRLASYVFKLKNNYGIDIQTTREPNSNGRGHHGRYRLLSDVRILEIGN